MFCLFYIVPVNILVLSLLNDNRAYVEVLWALAAIYLLKYFCFIEVSTVHDVVFIHIVKSGVT